MSYEHTQGFLGQKERQLNRIIEVSINYSPPSGSMQEIIRSAEKYKSVEDRIKTKYRPEVKCTFDASSDYLFVTLESPDGHESALERALDECIDSLGLPNSVNVGVNLSELWVNRMKTIEIPERVLKRRGYLLDMPKIGSVAGISKRR